MRISAIRSHRTSHRGSRRPCPSGSIPLTSCSTPNSCARIGNPSCLYVFRLKEPNAQAVIEFHPTLIVSMVEHLMGGAAGEEKSVRPITRIEQNVVRGLIQRSLSDLQRAWKTAADITFAYDRYESEAELMHLAPASEIVMVVAFEVTIGATKHVLNVCFPISGIEEVLARLNVQSHAGVRKAPGDPTWSKPLLRNMETTRVPVTAKMGESVLTVRELLTLEQGDILRTRIAIDSEVALVIGGVPRFLGRPGISRGNLAVKVSRIISEQQAGE